MIEFLKGRLVEKNPSYLVIECNGVGYFINVSLHTYSQITDKELITVYTHVSIREDAHVLYGFASTDERDFFRQLISVSGVGATTAQLVLSSLSPVDAAAAIVNEEVAILQGVKGIGGKTAQRIIIDLKDKVNKLEINPEISFGSHNTNKQEALSALLALGFDKNKSGKLLDKLLKTEPEMPVEALVKSALKRL